MTKIALLAATIALGALAAGSAQAMTQAELDKECTRIWGPPDHHYTPNGCVKGKLVRSKADAEKRLLIMGPLPKAPDTPAKISDQAAAGNLTSFKK